LDRDFVFLREKNGAGKVFGGLGLDGDAVAASGGGARGVGVRV